MSPEEAVTYGLIDRVIVGREGPGDGKPHEIERA